MTECEALLRAVCENPDDDTPRLIFADYLGESGEPERAEFIRVQVRFAAMLRGAEPAGTEVLRKWERAIWADHKAAFRSELPEIAGVAWFDEFHRGFVERVTVSSDTQLVRHADAIFNQVPVQHLTIRRFTAADGFERLPYLQRLKTLKLANHAAEEALVRALTGCDQFNGSVLVFVSLRRLLGRDRGVEDELRRVFGGRVSLTE